MRTDPLLLAFLVLCAGRRLTCAETFFPVEGEDFKAKFLFYTPAKQMYFCKNDCEKKEDVLVQTNGTRVQNGRYTIEFDQYSSPFVLHVGISDLSSSDSGSYRCETWSGGVKVESVKFQIDVSRASSAPPSVVVSSFHKETPGPQVSSASPDGTRRTRGSTVSSAVHNRTTETRRPSPEQTFNHVSLYVALAAALLLLLVTLSVSLYWKKKRGNKPKESMECAQIPERNHEYEEVPDGNRAAPVYNLLSGPGQQSQVEVSANTSTYSEVNFTRSSSSSAPECPTGESAGQTVVYSTVTSPQQ